MPRWYDNAVEELEDSLDKSEISNEDFRNEMRELNQELQSAADEVAEAAREDYYGSW